MRWTHLLSAVFVVMILAAAPVSHTYGQEAGVQVHEVKEGENLFRIAKKYDTTVERIRELNDLEDYTIYMGQRLIVGTAEKAEESVSLADVPVEEQDAGEHEPGQEEPVEEDTTAQAQQSTTPEDDSTLSDLDAAVDTTETAQADDEDELLPIAGDESDTTVEADTVEADTAGVEDVQPEARLDGPHGWHVIEEGESLYSIAGRYGLSVDTLKSLNEAVPAYLTEGDSLRLPRSYAGFVHTVQEGETIADVAGQYGVSVRGLQHMNGLESRSVTPGQELFIPGRPAPEPEPRGSLPPVTFSGMVEAYPAAFEGRLTASGTPYDPSELVVSHSELPFGAVVLLTNPQTGRNTFARVIDRGPLDEELVMDVSTAVAEALQLDEADGVEVDIRVVEQPE